MEKCGCATSRKKAPWLDRVLLGYYRLGWRGFFTLLRWRQRLASGNTILAANSYGACLYLNAFNLIDRFVLRYGYYESEVLEALLPWLEDGSVFWDVGANFGLHSVTVKRLRPMTQVVSFEPAPGMMAQLLANCTLNGLAVDARAVALGAEPGYRTFHVLEEGNPGGSTFHPEAGASYARTLTCWCDTGDRMVAAGVVPGPTAMKIDVEGSELEVLRGCANILRSPGLRALVFEAPLDFLDPAVQHPVRELLEASGFSRISRLERREPTEHRLANYLALRATAANQ